MSNSSFYTNILDSLQNFEIDYCFNKEQLEQIIQLAKVNGYSFIYHIVYAEDNSKNIDIIELIPIVIKKNGKKEKRTPENFISMNIYSSSMHNDNITLKYNKITPDVKEQLSPELLAYIKASQIKSHENRPRRNLKTLQIKKMKDECTLRQKESSPNYSMKINRDFSFSCSFLESC